MKSIKEITEREQRPVRKIWREKTRRYEARLKQQSTENHSITPLTYDNENQPLHPRNNVALTAKRRLDSQWKRNKVINKRKIQIKQLRQKLGAWLSKEAKVYRKTKNDSKLQSCTFVGK